MWSRRNARAHAVERTSSQQLPPTGALRAPHTAAMRVVCLAPAAVVPTTISSLRSTTARPGTFVTRSSRAPPPEYGHAAASSQHACFARRARCASVLSRRFCATQPRPSSCSSRRRLEARRADEWLRLGGGRCVKAWRYDGRYTACKRHCISAVCSTIRPRPRAEPHRRWVDVADVRYCGTGRWRDP